MKAPRAGEEIVVGLGHAILPISLKLAACVSYLALNSLVCTLHLSIKHTLFDLIFNDNLCVTFLSDHIDLIIYREMSLNVCFLYLQDC